MSAQPFCPHFNQNQCRSCQWLEIPYAEQLEAKKPI